jgi:uncharacterized protein (TIRG00374 family)
MSSSEQSSAERRGIVFGWKPRLIPLVKAGVGIAIVVALVLWGQIDLSALSALRNAPSTLLVGAATVALTLPLAALRWHILLRTLGISMGLVRTFHFVAISTVANVFLLGTAGGDAVRMLYAWQASDHGRARIVVSVVLDRMFGFLGLMLLATGFVAVNWHWMRHRPALAFLAMSVVGFFAVAMSCALAILLMPRLVGGIERRLKPFPRIEMLVGQLRQGIQLIVGSPGALLAALALAVAIHALTIATVVVVATSFEMGGLSVSDFVLAVPLTLVANALPLTPNGLGVGELAFDQICRWLEPAPSGASYSSIFFAFRAISMVVSLVGLISFALYRKAPANSSAR